MQIVEFLSRRSRATMLMLGMTLVLYIGAVDYLSGPMVAMMVFYTLPICLVAWFAGRWPGCITALSAAIVWYAAKLMDPDPISQGLLLFWNFSMRCFVFALLGFLTTEVAERRRVEEALRASQESLEQRVRLRTLELAQANEALQSEVIERTQAQSDLKHLNETLEQRVSERSAAAEQRARELARSEAALRQQRGILQSILNSMGDGVLVADSGGNILLFNPAAERLLRGAQKRPTAEAWFGPQETYLPDTLTAYPTSEHPLRRAIRGEVIDGAEIFLRSSSTSEGIWLSATGRPLLDETASVQGGVVVFSDITARKLMEKQIAEVSDREQRRIGQDLHDGLCQHLVSTTYAGELLRQKLEPDFPSVSAQVEAIVEMVNEAISQARHLARGLYPVRLEEDGLASALEELALTVQARSNTLCEFTCDDPVFINDEVAGSNLYRIAQEAVNNAIKHSRASRISIGLGAVEDEVTLTIKDDGIGFPDTVSHSGGMGLHIMNYRAKMIGASLDIRRGARGGTIVICSFHNENSSKQPLLIHKE